MKLKTFCCLFGEYFYLSLPVAAQYLGAGVQKRSKTGIYVYAAVSNASYRHHYSDPGKVSSRPRGHNRKDTHIVAAVIKK